MDFEYRLKRKCFSLLISLIFHALLLLLLFMLVYQVAFNKSNYLPNFDNSNNVTVTFQKPTVNQNTNQFFNQTNGQTSESENENILTPEESSQNIEKSEKITEMTDKDDTVNLTDEPETVSEKDNAEDDNLKKQEISGNLNNFFQDNRQTILEETSPINNVSKSLEDQKTDKKVEKKLARKRRMAVLAKNLINSFTNSYRNEREIFTPSNNIRTNHAFVEERIEEFRIADFMKKVNEAIVQAIHKTPQVKVYSQKNYEKKIVIQIEHLKDGKIKILTFESTEIPEVDYQIKTLLNSISFPPIPERFKKNSVTYTQIFGVSVREGMNICRFYAL